MEKDIIQEQFDALPTEVQRVLGRVPWRTLVKNLASRAGLSEERAQNLETETMLVLYGFAPAEEFFSNLSKRLKVDGIEAKRLEEMVIKEVFGEIEKEYEKVKGKTPEEPVIITPETKESALKELSEREAKNHSVPEEPPPDLPMVEPGEVAHDVPPLSEKIETAPEPTLQNPEPVNEPMTKPEALTALETAPAGNQRYPEGKDPYREPLA